MIRSKTQTILTAAAASALLAACAVGPKAPVADLPVAGTGALIGSANPAVSTAQTRDDWWRLYDDPTLDGLIQQAFAENNQLEAAFANLRAVRASLSEARTGRLPTTSTSAAYQRSRASAATVQGLPPGQDAPEIDTYDVGLDASY
ncbi:TolC family protein, partial [uncultured Brevundimonas sp.]|uniref:TolC family protein n=1 Tax=uncultured Brevundimonas sp. TaxID=213418 RepID=UPI002599FF0A